jgi:hypothetical protein
MVIGLKYGDDMEITYKKVRDFIRNFKETTTTTVCMDLLNGCNLLTEEGRIFFNKNGLRQKNCSEYVKLACSILEELLK